MAAEVGALRASVAWPVQHWVKPFIAVSLCLLGMQLTARTTPVTKPIVLLLRMLQAPKLIRGAYAALRESERLELGAPPRPL